MGLKKEYIDTVVPESTGGVGRSSGTAFAALPSVKIVIAGIVLAALQVASMNGLLSSSFVYALGNTLIYAIAAIGFCLLLGYSGLASLGTAGFSGLGAGDAGDLHRDRRDSRLHFAEDRGHLSCHHDPGAVGGDTQRAHGAEGDH